MTRRKLDDLKQRIRATDFSVDGDAKLHSLMDESRFIEEYMVQDEDSRKALQKIAQSMNRV